MFNHMFQPHFAKEFLKQYHSLAHPGIRWTRHLISNRFFWQQINTDIGNWVRTCIPCQKTKILKHTTTPIFQFYSPNLSVCLQHVHIELIGPLPVSKGNRYCLTMIDRITCWPEAVPISDMCAETVTEAFLETWISRFGCSSVITADQGCKFESELFHQLRQYFGIKHTCSYPYHPQCNGKIEDFHRTLKAALGAYFNSPPWTNHLPVVMLAFTSSINCDAAISPTIALFGQELRLPGDLFAPCAPESQSQFLQKISVAFQKFRNMQHHDTKKRSFVSQNFKTCTHAFVQDDNVKPPSTAAYKNPFKLIERSEKTYSVEDNSKSKIISLDRLNSAYMLPESILLTEKPLSKSLSEPLSTRGGRSQNIPPNVHRTKAVLLGNLS